MQFVEWFLKLIYYYEADAKSGKPYWQDPAFVGLMVSLLATEAAKLYGLQVDADLQLKIVGSVTGLGVLFSPHTGVKKAPAPQSTIPGSGHDLSSLS